MNVRWLKEWENVIKVLRVAETHNLAMFEAPELLRGLEIGGEK